METLHQAPGRLLAHPLGNFLSGMETHFASTTPYFPRSLGNFLSGMETRPHRREAGRGRGTLETSLVEWKLEPEEPNLVFHSFLGNFLSGMETQYIAPEDWPQETPWKLP